MLKKILLVWPLELRYICKKCEVCSRYFIRSRKYARKHGVTNITACHPCITERLRLFKIMNEKVEEAEERGKHD